MRMSRSFRVGNVGNVGLFASLVLLLAAAGCGGGGAAPPGSDAGSDRGSSDTGTVVDDGGSDTSVDTAGDASDAGPSSDAGGGGDATDAASCTDQCASGTSICAGAQVRHCEMQTSGCFDYSPAVSCSTGRSCQAGACVFTCTDQCTSGSAACVGGKLASCALQASGCFDYNDPVSCATGSTCQGNACVATCTNQCVPGAATCAGAQIRNCALQASGCYDYGAATDCTNGYTCQGNACAASCTNKCTAGSKTCVGGQIADCAMQTSGCYDYNAPTACPSGRTCQGNACVLTCTDQCTVGDTVCMGDQIRTCALQSSGCNDYGAAAACPSGQACQNKACAAVCTDKCTAGSALCAGDQIQQCALQASGCYDYAAAAACPNGDVCRANACVPPPCVVGATRCGASAVEMCDGSGTFVAQQICSQACDASTKQCVDTTTCTPSAWRCAGNVVEQCNPTGTAWRTVVSCAGSCAAGACTGTCTPGQKQCNGNVPETCNAAGTGYTQGTACSTSCYRGDCAGTGLVVDGNANATLDGDNVYTGDVIIRNTSTLRAPSGVLRIRAKNVTIDVSSSLIIQPTGDNAAGRGQDGGSKTCQFCCFYSWCLCTYCYPSDPITVGGGGGGHGLAGTTAVTGWQYNGTCDGGGMGKCSASSSGGAAYGRPDIDETVGSGGGACTSGTPGHGGGLLVIDAETITVAGTISAMGEAASGCAGGGSGGMVILRASQNLTVTGAVWAQGGAGGGTLGGAGGNGVVKLLYGDAKTITGAVMGVTYQSLIPPLDLSSATHPDPSRVYNDGAPSFDLAWSRPFSTTNGYYRATNATLSFVPTADASSRFQTGEAAVFAPSPLASGVNYFHAVSVGPAAVLGTVESRYPVKVNSSVPSVASSSHADSATWYNNPDVFISWTLPAGIANTDVKAFYWVLDRFKTTIPTKQDNRQPMSLTDPASSMRLLLPGNAQGVWFFHVLWEDSMGYLTKSAATFQFQVGPTAGLGTGGLSGTVSQAGSPGTLLSGVSITLNRGMATGTTNTSGVYTWASNALVAESYEIRASKTGYADYVGTVTIVSGQTTIFNFAMTPQ
ncbi:MAG TPA: carboxypeptidase regulatory-like domain-containing protein [Polyangia bacterium]